MAGIVAVGHVGVRTRDLEKLTALGDPSKDKLIALAKQHGEEPPSPTPAA